MKVICVLVALILIANTAGQVPPKVWPGTWYTWVVTSVVVGTDKPNYNYGQLIAYDTLNQVACRASQQNLLTPAPARPLDVCDFTAGIHYMMDDTNTNSTCKGISQIQGSLAQIVYPPEYLAVARFLGVDKVAQKDCNHFSAQGIVVDGDNLQMDVWTATDTSFPCQISVTELVTPRVVTTWAFDGFTNIIPPLGLGQCSAAKIMCAEENWVCNSKPGADPAKLQSAIAWVCDPTHLDCSPINPGGPHYIPNTLVDHCNWAFNAYYRLHRTSQGVAACDFGGIAAVIPPANSTHAKSLSVMSLNKVLSNNIVCDRTA